MTAFMRSRAAWLVMALVLAGALFVGSQTGLGRRTESQRVQHIASEIRCPECRSETSANSNATQAKAVRAEIRDRIRAGESDGQIVAFLVSRYGSDILLKPEGSGVAGLVWALPVVGLVVALGALTMTFRRWRARPGVEVSPEDRALVERELRGTTS